MIEQYKVIAPMSFVILEGDLLKDIISFKFISYSIYFFVTNNNF